MGGIELLERPMYSIGFAATLLGLPAQTLKRWLVGTTVRGVAYPPVIREHGGATDAVTWGEFVEAGFLREYRTKRIPLPKMRTFINSTRDEFGVPYPLAHFKPMVDPANRKLVYELQRRAGLEPSLYLVQAEDDQLVLTEVAQGFLDKVDFSRADGYVSKLWPVGKQSPVMIDPNLSFGSPQIRGIRTELIAESLQAGGYKEASTAWGLSPSDIDAAQAFEQTLARAA